MGNDKQLDIATDNSFQNGVKFAPPKIESRSNFCDDFAAWVAFRKRFSLSLEVVALTGG
jgi:hypothetical protein